MTAGRTLYLIRLLHTVVWLFFVVCIIGIPLFAWLGNFRASFTLIGVVLVEVFVLAINRMRCPLTDVAARYTDDRADNFDIFLPLIIARYNKHIFGPLFLVGTLFTLFRWAGRD